MGHEEEPGADEAHTATCGFDKWQASENEMRRRAECYPALLAALATIANTCPPHGHHTSAEAGRFARTAFRKARAGAAIQLGMDGSLGREE